MNQRKVKAAEHFGVHAFTLGHAIQLTAYRPFRQYCLQQAGAPSVKTFTLTQNVLRPVEIHLLKFLLCRKLRVMLLKAPL